LSDLVCSADVLYHYLCDDSSRLIASILKTGLRPLSDFPESERRRQIERHLPGIFETLYHEFAEPTIDKPYVNSGVFLTPIDFRQIPDSIMARKPRFRIPLGRLDPAWSAVTYEHDGRRVSRPLSSDVLRDVSALAPRSHRDLVRRGRQPSVLLRAAGRDISAGGDTGFKR